MFGNIVIEWDGGPDSIKSQYDMLISSNPRYEQLVSDSEKEEFMNREKVRTVYDGFIPEDRFVISLCATVTEIDDDNFTRIDKIYKFVKDNLYPFHTDIMDCCNSLREFRLFWIVQACFIEFVYHNNNVRLFFGKENTDYIMKVFSDDFGISADKIRSVVLRILKLCKCKENDENHYRCVKEFYVSDLGVLHVVLRNDQQLCRHSLYQR